MASSINASTSGAGGVITTADASGNLNIQSGGSTVLSLTSSGVAITGTLSATSITGAGGMTLLGTVSTTSGTSVTLSGLTLTNYKSLFLSINGFSSTDSYGGIHIPSSKLIAQNITVSNVVYGTCWIDLSTGVFSATWKDTGWDGVSYASISTLSTSSTSITFTSSIGSFDAGSIKVYGVA